MTTDDGSLGTQGTVLALLPDMLSAKAYDCVYVCGPAPMMKAVSAAALAAGLPCQVSLENTWAVASVPVCPAPARVWGNG